MVNLARNVVRATFLIVGLAAMTSPAAGHPVRRQVDLVLDENGDPIDPTLVIVQDPPPPPPPPPSPVYIAVEPPVPPPQPARPKIPARTMLGFRIGVGKLVEHVGREREFVNIYRSSDAARSLSDEEFAQVLTFVESAFEMALAFKLGER